MNIEARPWTPQDLLDDLQSIIDEESDSYLNTRRTTLETALAYLKEHFAAGSNVGHWIPVSERLPEEEGVVLVCGSRGGIYTAEFRRRGDYFWFHKLNSKCHHCEPTHWMPLPKRPGEV